MLPLPQLLDLARKPAFPHNKTVVGLEALPDPKGGTSAPHAFQVQDAVERAAIAAFLRSMDTWIPRRTSRACSGRYTAIGSSGVRKEKRWKSVSRV